MYLFLNIIFEVRNYQVSDSLSGLGTGLYTWVFSSINVWLLVNSQFTIKVTNIKHSVALFDATIF